VSEPTLSSQPHFTHEPAPPPALGLVCITLSDEVRYRTITRTRLRQFAEAEQQTILRELYTHNLARFHAALTFCQAHQLHLYRFPANLFPFADTPVGAAVLTELAPALQAAGQRASAAAIRIVVHPDQFVVLSSESPSVVANSIANLTMQGWIMDLLEQPRSPWALMEIHGGKGGGGARLVQVIQQLPPAIRSRLCLENDENAYSAQEILTVCQAAGVPMIFDAHHHICKEKLTSYEDPSVAAMVAAARATWPDPTWQVVHLSNGREHFGHRSHSDLISAVPSAYLTAPWLEVEAKHKEVAIEHLRQNWPARETPMKEMSVRPDTQGVPG